MQLATYKQPMTIREHSWSRRNAFRVETHLACNNYITSTSSKLDNWVTISEDHERVRKVIQLLCRNEPITGLFQFSILDASERKFIVQLSDGGSAKEESLNLIYQKMHTLECLIKSIQPSIDISGYVTLHPIVASLLKKIMTQIDSLSRKPTRRLVDSVPIIMSTTITSRLLIKTTSKSTSNPLVKM